jgi:hypothetical protein
MQDRSADLHDQTVLVAGAVALILVVRDDREIQGLELAVQALEGAPAAGAPQGGEG